MKDFIKIFEVAYVKNVFGPQLFWMNEWDKKYSLSFQVILIRQKNKIILMNTGLTEEILPEVNEIWGKNDKDGKLIKKDNIINILERKNLTQDDINIVLITPFRHYTMGYLDMFKKSEILLSKKGWFEFHNKKYNNESREFTIPSRILKYLMFEGWNNIRLLEDEDIIDDNISTFWCGCHHRSSIAIKIKINNKIIIISDCFFKLRNIEENLPIGLSENIYECFDAYKRIKEEADIFISLYDPDNFIRFKNGIVL
jgi:hypothetical protein